MIMQKGQPTATCPRTCGFRLREAGFVDAGSAGLLLLPHLGAARAAAEGLERVTRHLDRQGAGGSQGGRAARP